MYKSSICLLIVISAITIGSTRSREIEVPSFQDSNAVNIKLGLTKQIQQPDFEFSKVYERQVQKIDSSSMYKFEPCFENKPEVQFQVLDEIVFDGIPKRPRVITEFNDIKYSQFLLDVYYEDLKVYMMFKNKKVAVVTLQTDEKIKDKIVFDVTGDSGEEYLEVGYFVKVNSYLLFVNKNFTILVNEKSASIVPGYYPIKDFQTVISLQNSTFAVLQSLNGVNIYYFDGLKVRKVQRIRAPEVFQNSQIKIQLQDIAYWKQKKILIILDRVNGIKSVQITFKFDPALLGQTPKPQVPVNILDIDPRTTNNTDYATHFIDIELKQRIAPTNNCKMIYLYFQTLYVYCGSMTSYNLEKWPLVQEIKLPYPNIQLKQIYKVDDMVAFVGRNSFSLMYLNRMVSYYEDQDLDKLIFSKNMFISASEEGVDIGNYVIIKPYITCYTKDEAFLGISHLQFKTYAQCNDSYFEKFQVNKTRLGDITSDDTCIYTVYKPVNYWKVGQIKTYPFLFALIGITVIVLAIVIYFITRKVKLYRVVAMIEQQSRFNNHDSAKPHHFVQQMEGGQIDTKKAESKDQNADKKPSQVELHDI